MQFFKSALTLTTLLVLTSALNVERHGAKTKEMRLPNVLSEASTVITHVKTNGFHSLGSCEKEDEADCKEFCGASEQSATCSADGNKVTCYCKGGKAPEQNCEERCLLCMPGKQALEEAKEAFKLGGTRIEL